MWIEYSGFWGQDDYPWNYCGGDYNYKTKRDFVEFYGIIKSKRIDEMFIPEKKRFVPEYEGFATKNLELVRKHWSMENQPAPPKEYQPTA